MIIPGPVHDSPTGGLVVPLPLLNWRLRCMEPAEKRPQRYRFGCRRRAPSDRRRLQPSRGSIIGCPVHDSPTGRLVAPPPLLSCRPRCMEPAEKRPLRSRFGCINLAPSGRRRDYASWGARIGGPVPGRATVAPGISRKGFIGACIFAWRSPGKRVIRLKQQSASV